MTSDEKKAAGRRATIRVTCLWSLVTSFLLAGCGKSGDNGNNAPPPDAAGHKQNFTSVEYYPESNPPLMKARMTGAEAQPLPGGLLAVKQLLLETFSANGGTQAVVSAPECVYDLQNRAANSAGHLQLRSGDGKIRTEGDGFLWREDDSFLTISNNVHTVIKTSALKRNTP